MKSKLIYASSAALAALLLAMTGCSVDTTGTSKDESGGQKAASDDRSWNSGGKVTVPAPTAGAGKGINIMFTGFGQDNNLANAFFEAVKGEAELYGASAEFAGPPSYDPVAQSKLICDAASSGRYKAIVMQTIDSASAVECAKQAVQAGIKIATIEFPIGPDVTSEKIQLPGVVTQIREDVVAIAESQATEVAKRCEGVDPCKVGVLWGVRSLAFDAAKVAPFKKVLADHPNVKIVCESDAGYQEDSGRTTAADCLSANRDLNVIAAGSDESAHGAELAITGAGRNVGLGKDDVKIIAAYARKYGVQQIIDGKWAMSTFSRPNADGRAAVDYLLASFSKTPVPENVNSQDLDLIGLTVTADTAKSVPDLLQRAY